MTKSNERHVPVLLQEAIDFLRVRAGGYVRGLHAGIGRARRRDCPAAGAQGHLIGFDRDPEALELAKARLDRVCEELGSQAPQVTLVGEAFSSHCRACAAGFGGWLAGRFWSEQPAVGRGAQRIQFSGGRAVGYAYGYALRGRPPHKW